MRQMREAKLEDVQQLMKLEKTLFSKWDNLDPIDKIDVGGVWF